MAREHPSQLRHPRLCGRLAVAAAFSLLIASCRRAPAPPLAQESLSVALPYEVITLDPHAKDKLGSNATLSNLYEPLVTTDKDLKILPCLATSWESPDPRTWVFHVRPGVSFHSGRALTAADVVFSLRRVTESRSLEMRTYVLDVAEVRAIDPMTVQIRTLRPAPLLLSKLSAVPVVPEGSTEGGLARSANGTGPYELAAWTQASNLRLRRNQRYWGRPPSFPSAEILLQRDPESAARGLVEGRFQLIQCDSKKAIERLSDTGRFNVVRRKNLYVKYLGFDHHRAVTPFSGARSNPFRNVRVREAVSLALDRQRLVAELAGEASPANQLVPRFVFGFNPRMADPVHDPARARSLLRQAGLAQGFDVVLHVRRILTDTAFIVARQLAEVGIRVEARPLADADFYELADRREVSFFLSRFGCVSGDSSDLFDDLIHSLQKDRHLGTRNFGSYSSPAMDRAIEASAGIESTDERRKRLQEIMAKVIEDLVLVPLYNDEDAYAMETFIAWEPRADSQVRIADIGRRP
jgi:peptide/nickel transport system substrate-binding protein